MVATGNGNVSSPNIKLNTCTAIEGRCTLVICWVVKSFDVPCHSIPTPVLAAVSQFTTNSGSAPWDRTCGFDGIWPAMPPENIKRSVKIFHLDARMSSWNVRNENTSIRSYLEDFGRLGMDWKKTVYVVCIPRTPRRRSKWHTPRHQASINSDQTDPFPLFTDRQLLLPTASMNFSQFQIWFGSKLISHIPKFQIQSDSASWENVPNFHIIYSNCWSAVVQIVYRFLPVFTYHSTLRGFPKKKQAKSGPNRIDQIHQGDIFNDAFHESHHAWRNVCLGCVLPGISSSGLGVGEFCIQVLISNWFMFQYYGGCLKS